MKKTVTVLLFILALTLMTVSGANATESNTLEAEPANPGFTANQGEGGLTSSGTEVMESGFTSSGNEPFKPEVIAEPTEENPLTNTEAIAITVSYREGEEILKEITLKSGEKLKEVPLTDSQGKPILGWVIEGKKITDPTGMVVSQDTICQVWMPPVLNTIEHLVYITGKGNGQFDPKGNLTRAEASSMIYSLLVDKSLGDCLSNYSDVGEGEWYSQSVAVLSSLGILSGYADGSFLPHKTISRAEFVTMLSGFYELEEGHNGFTDLADSYWAGGYIISATQKGWIKGYEDGSFLPDKTITRAEATSVINAVLDRSASAEATQQIIAAGQIGIFLDVKPADWFYFSVVEASIEHEYTLTDTGEVWSSFTYRSCGYPVGVQEINGYYYQVNENLQFVSPSPGATTIEGLMYYADADGRLSKLSLGLQEINGNLYYVQEDGSFLTNQTQGYLYFGEDGAYTSGNSDLDALVKQDLAELVNSEMSQEEKLRTAYLYVRDNFTYLSRPHQARGSIGWAEESASFMLKNHKGNCYCFAGAFLYLARQLGYQAYPVSGGVGTDNSDHAWVMIDSQLYDVELEYAYRYRYANTHYYNLYQISPSKAPFIYYFPN